MCDVVERRKERERTPVSIKKEIKIYEKNCVKRKRGRKELELDVLDGGEERKGVSAKKKKKGKKIK